MLAMCSTLLGGGVAYLSSMFYDKEAGVRLEEKVTNNTEGQKALKTAISEQTKVMREVRDAVIELKTELRIRDEDK